jgi:preprotein translocase subunit SecG
VTLFLTVVHVIVCVFLIIVVLLQRGKGAEIGAVFGGGGGSTLFGSRGAGNFLTRLTTGAALVFMVTSLSLAYFADTGTRSTLFEEDAPAASESKPSPFAEPGDGGAETDSASDEGSEDADEGGFVEVAPTPDAEPADAEPDAGAASEPTAEAEGEPESSP